MLRFNKPFANIFQNLVVTCFCRFAALFIMWITMACHITSEPELHVLAWSDYIKPELLEKFREQHHTRIIVDTFDSNESMYAKLKLGADGYDLIFPSSYFMDIMNAQQMLQPINRELIPNVKNLDQAYLNLLDPSQLNYGVPYMVSSSGVAYRTDKVAAFDPSWKIFGESQYKGRMTMLNDARETIGAALKFLGYSANTTDKEQIEKAVQQILEWKKNLAKFESEQYKAGIASAEYLIVNGYNGDILQVMKENPNIAFVYPKEGITLSIDLMVIPKDAPNPELAHTLINFLLDPEIASENIQFTLFFSPNLAAYKKLPSELQSNPILFLPKEVLNKAETIRFLGPNTFLYNKAWDKIKSN